MLKTRTIAAGAVSLFLMMAALGCTKKVAVAPPPPPPKAETPQVPRPNAPVVLTFAVEPAAIERGQSATLRWNVSDATHVEIDQGIGAVAASGDRRVAPDEPVTYRLLAMGPGGVTAASATLQVNLPLPPPPPPAVAPPVTISHRLANEVHDVYFDFDRSDLRPDASSALSSDAAALKSILAEFPTFTVILEGHCDERGSAEYNLGLGDRRGTAVQAFLRDLGATDRLVVISYGKERPQCTESTEECWQKNRRVHFAPGENQLKHVRPGAE